MIVKCCTLVGRMFIYAVQGWFEWVLFIHEIEVTWIMHVYGMSLLWVEHGIND